MKRVYRGLKRYGHEALRAHVLQIADLGRQRHGPIEGPGALAALLADRDCVRFETDLVFDAAPLEPGLFADSVAGEGQRLTLYVHPLFRDRPADLPLVVAYHIPSICYGKMASSDDAEAYGARLLDLEVDDYYARLCQLAELTE